MLITGFDYETEAKKESVHRLEDESDKSGLSIDLLARNTIENAINAAQWTMEKGVKSIRLITSESHMDRAYFELRRILPQDITIFSDEVPDFYAADQGFNSEANMLKCRMYETVWGFSFCYEAREAARHFGLV